MSAGRRSVGVGRKEVTSCNATVSPRNSFDLIPLQQQQRSVRPSVGLFIETFTFLSSGADASFICSENKEEGQRKKKEFHHVSRMFFFR